MDMRRDALSRNAAHREGQAAFFFQKGLNQRFLTPYLPPLCGIGPQDIVVDVFKMGS